MIVFGQFIRRQRAVQKIRAGLLSNANVLNNCKKGKGKVFPYSLLSVGAGADPGVQAVSPQVT